MGSAGEEEEGEERWVEEEEGDGTERNFEFWGEFRVKRR